MIRLDHVEKEYGDFHLECSMEVKKGYVTGLVGPNGAGKSTIFKLILGLIAKNGGSVELLGQRIEEPTAAMKQRLGVVLADSGFSGYVTVGDLIPVMESLYPGFERETFVRKCKQFRVPLDKKIKDFSTGMKRKLQVLAALSHQAELLLLDEPTSGLDVVARDELLDLLREYMEQEDHAVLISSHISTDLEGFCDDIYMIDNGEMILHEDTDVLMDRYAIVKATKEQYEKLDRRYLLRVKKEPFGYSCLTSQKQFYVENAPELTIEKGTIDEVIMMMIRGERL